MADKYVIILDSDSAQVEYYESYLAEYPVNTRNYPSLQNFFGNYHEDNFFLLLISYQIILASERAEVIELFQKLRDQEIVVYDVPENANRRLAFYDLGARRVYDTSYSPQEVCHSLKWLINVLLSDGHSADIYLRGRLEDFPVQSLILLLGRENRTGVLKLISAHNSGKIYFFNGNIDAAQVGTHSGKEAVLHMLLWEKGDFIFSPADHLAQETKISLSNYGFIIMARQILEETEENLRQIGPPKCVLRVQYIGDLLQAGLDINLRFAEHIKSPRTLADVLENPVYTSFETAQKLALLKRKGFIFINEAVERSLSQVLPRAEEEAAAQLALPCSQIEIDNIKENLDIDKEQKSIKLIALFNPQLANAPFVRTFIPEMIEEPHTEIKGITQLTLSAEFNTYLLGMEADQKSMDFILGLGNNDFNGYIFLVDAAAEAFFEYTNYLINHLLTNKPLPAVVALYGLQEEQTTAEVQSRFFTPRGLNWVACPQEQEEALHVVLSAVQDIKEPEQDSDEKSEEEAQENVEGIVEETAPEDKTEQENEPTDGSLPEQAREISGDQAAGEEVKEEER